MRRFCLLFSLTAALVLLALTALLAGRAVELNFLLMPFLSHQIPSGMKVNAAEVMRKALKGSTLTTGYKHSLDRLKIHSMTINTGISGGWLVVDVDGDLSVKQAARYAWRRDRQGGVQCPIVRLSDVFQRLRY